MMITAVTSMTSVEMIVFRIDFSEKSTKFAKVALVHKIIEGVWIFKASVDQSTVFDENKKI